MIIGATHRDSRRGRIPTLLLAAFTALALLAALTAGSASAKNLGQWTQADVDAGLTHGASYLDSVIDRTDPTNLHWDAADDSGDVTQTAFALAAIGIARDSNPSNVTALEIADAKNAVQWLIKQQDTSSSGTKGSWGVSSGSSDSNYATSLALIALSFFSTEPKAANATALGRNFEISWQNAPPSTTGNASSSCTAPSGGSYGNCGSWTYSPFSSCCFGGDGSNTGFGLSGLEFSGGVPKPTAAANLGWARAIEELSSNPYATLNDGGGSYEPGETYAPFRSSANGSGTNLFELAYDGVAKTDAGAQAAMKLNTDVLDAYEKSKSASPRQAIYHDPSPSKNEDGSCQVGATGCDWFVTGDGGLHYSLFAISKGFGSYVAPSLSDATNFYAKVVDLLLSEQTGDGSWPKDLRDDGSTIGGTAFSMLALGKAGQTQAEAATISGVVYNDANSNGKRDPGESGLGGWTVYLDVNGNGTHDSGEPSAVTAGDGSYTITQVSPGTYTVREVTQSGFSCTQPSGCAYTNVHVTNGQSATGFEFGNHQNAPLTPIVAPAPAAKHCVVPHLVGKTVKQARKLLTRNHCRLGGVHAASDPKRRGKRIVRQSRKPGSVLPARTRVSVTLKTLRPAKPPAPKPNFTG